MSIARRIRDAQGRSSWIRRMFEQGAHLKLERGEGNVFDFTLGNPCEEPPQGFVDNLRLEFEQPRTGKYAYMSNAGYHETRAAVASHLCLQRDLPIEPEHILMTCGAAGGLNVVLKALLDPGEEVIVLAPFFPEYLFYVENHGGTVRFAETRRDFSLDPDAVEAAISPKTKAILINSPNNPTGRMYDEESVRQLCDRLEHAQKRIGKDLYLISDEPYAEIVFDGKLQPDLFRFFTNTILVNSYSKSLSIPGERLGYVAIHPLSSDAKTLMDGMIFCNRTLGFVNAPATMQRALARNPAVRVHASAYQRKRDLLCEGLREAGYSFHVPEGAFYLFPESPIPDDVAFVEALLEEGVLVVPGAGFGRRGHFRIAYCVREETIRKALPAFASVRKAIGR